MGAALDNGMKRLQKFTEWLRLREGALAGPQTKLTPAQQTAQDVTTTALQKMPMKPGQTPAEVLEDPMGQKKLLDQANKQAKSQGKQLNLGAAAGTMDAAKAADPKQGV